MQLFDVVKHINRKTEENREEVLEAYVPFMINRALSMSKHSIFYALEMSALSNVLDKGQAYDFYYNILPRNTQWSPWAKKSKLDDESLVEIVCTKYKCNPRVALSYLSVMGEDEKSALKRYKGGINRGKREK